ncbi:MAG: flagellar protein FlgN [Alphaproteobacteria bacterium CG_4_9_14_3_um_filter_47_13]|nr:MAG: flagellar protein FlgN [Alphaproteobacteria bacterium CG_4_9_14_3_um_filter_47_13]
MATKKPMSMDTLKPETEHIRKIILSGDPNKAMQQMMNTIDMLRGVYVEENEALYSADTKRFLGLQEKKLKAARHYQYGAEQLLERKDELQHIDIALKKQLAEKQEEFSGVMSENLKAIDRLRRGVYRLNDRIMTSARESARKNNVNYSAKGELNKNERPVSIGLSESA